MSTTTPPPIAPASTHQHAHAAALDACLDFINTIVLTDGVPADELGTLDEAIAFLAGQGLGHDEALRAQARIDEDAWMARVREARRALRTIWDSTVDARPVEPPALAILNDILVHAPPPELRAGVAGVVVDRRHDPDHPLEEALARLAMPLVEVLASGDTSRFRVCANDGCRWVFEDTSRGGRRRWCDMASCGNRAKVRRFRSKRREAAGGGGPTPSRAGA